MATGWEWPTETVPYDVTVTSFTRTSDVERLSRSVNRVELPEGITVQETSQQALAACFSVVPSPAEAARSIEGPGGYNCDTFARTVSISPPRIWASYNRPEVVTWMTHIQRWNGTRWYVYGENVSYSSFNYYGQAVTPWWSGGGSGYQHTTLHIPVSHSGYYRVAAAIRGDQGGVQWVAFVSGGAYCYIR